MISAGGREGTGRPGHFRKGTDDSGNGELPAASDPRPGRRWTRGAQGAGPTGSSEMEGCDVAQRPATSRAIRAGSGGGGGIEDQAAGVRLGDRAGVEEALGPVAAQLAQQR